MNYIHHLNSFYAKLNGETRLRSAHISLYLAIFQCGNYYRFQQAFPLSRERLMRYSGIRSEETYHKCLNELHQFGYLRYYPSLHRGHRPKVTLIEWQTAPGQRQIPLFGPATRYDNTPSDTPAAHSTSPQNNDLTAPYYTASYPNNTLPNDGTPPPGSKNPAVGPQNMGFLQLQIGAVTAPKMEPFNKHINNINLERGTLAPGAPSENNPVEQQQESQALKQQPMKIQSAQTSLAYKTIARKPTQHTTTQPTQTSPLKNPPSWEEVANFFISIPSSTKEAAIFFNHYEANGWKQAGKIALTNWQAAARKWVIRAEDMKPRPAEPRLTIDSKLILQQNKSYDIPL